jgi:hypothetical protein
VNPRTVSAEPTTKESWLPFSAVSITTFRRACARASAAAASNTVSRSPLHETAPESWTVAQSHHPRLTARSKRWLDGIRLAVPGKENIPTPGGQESMPARLGGDAIDMESWGGAAIEASVRASLPLGTNERQRLRFGTALILCHNPHKPKETYNVTVSDAEEDAATLNCDFKRRHSAEFQCRLTVKLSGRTTTPDWRRGPTISSGTRGAKPQALHGPLQRLLGVTLVSVPLWAEMSERLHTFQVQTSLSPTPAQGRAAKRDARAWLGTPRGSAIVRT